MSRLLTMPACLLLAGCTATQPVQGHPEIRSVVDSEISLCVVASELSSYRGKTVRVSAEYQTDQAHYEFLTSSGCGKQGVFDVNNMGLELSPSVKNFYAQSKKRCTDKGAKYLCVTKASMQADVRIREPVDGRPSLDLVNVASFDFID